jgi:hypothetical protein
MQKALVCRQKKKHAVVLFDINITVVCFPPPSSKKQLSQNAKDEQYYRRVV